MLTSIFKPGGNTISPCQYSTKVNHKVLKRQCLFCRTLICNNEES